MKHKYIRRIILSSVLLLQLFTLNDAEKNCSTLKIENSSGRNSFSPRMDFNQWKPLGRGDPLKNDPTYDYVPPVLEQVHYWMEPALRKPDPPLNEDNKKKEILLLGVLQKKAAVPLSKADSRRDNFDTYVKKEPKFNPHQRISKPTFPLPSSFFPEGFFSSINKINLKNEKPNTPYTVLVPPPLKQKTLQNSLIPLSSPEVVQTQFPPLASTFTTPLPLLSTSSGSSSQVTIQPANLVYHSSSLSDESEWTNKNHHATIASSISWQPSTYPPHTPYTPHTLTTNKIKQGFRENLVFNKNLQPPESFIHIEFSPHNFSNVQLIPADSNFNLNYVTPPSLTNTEKLHKGSVSDYSSEIQNEYVKIEKPEFFSTGISNDDAFVKMNNGPNMMIYTHMKHPVMNEEMQTIKNMQTLLPPPATERPIYKEVSSNPILNALLKDKQKSSTPKLTTFLTQTPVFVIPGTTTTTTTTTQPTTTSTQPTTSTETFYPTEIITFPTTTTTSNVPQTTTAPITSTSTTTTTESPIKYFKTSEDLKNSVYFVIQGHSKVKTYGPTKNVHGISVQETNEIFEDAERSKYNIKHLHGFKKDTKEENPRSGRSGNLQTLKQVIQTGLGSIDVAAVEDEKLKRRHDLQETELQFGYNVADQSEVTSEQYYKGIVEEARK